MISDLLALAALDAAVVAAGLGVLRLVGFAPRWRDLGWTVALAYIVGAAYVGVLASVVLVLGAPLTTWQLLLICAAAAAGSLLRRGLGPPPPRHLSGYARLLPLAVAAVLGVLVVDLALQPLWSDDAWSIWAGKARSIVLLDGLDPALLASASVFNADYPLVVPVLDLLAYRAGGLDTELVPLQLGLTFLAFPWALVALLRDRVKPLVLWTVAVAVALAPSLQQQTASAVADVTLAVFLALAGVATWRWIDGDGNRWLGLSVILAAGAAGTKVEGGIFLGCLFVAAVVAAYHRGRSLRAFGGAAVLVAAATLPWELWSRAHGVSNAVAEAGGLAVEDAVTNVERLPSAGLSIVLELADPSSWIALVALGVVALLGALLDHRGRLLAMFATTVFAGSLASMLAVYWLTPLDFDYHVATSVRRVVAAPVLFLASLTPLLLASRDQQAS